MKKIILSAVVFIAAQLGIQAFAAEALCSKSFYKMSGTNVIKVCKSDGIMYYDSLSAVISDFINDSGIAQEKNCYVAPAEYKTDKDKDEADFVQKRLAGALRQSGKQVLEEAKENVPEIHIALAEEKNGAKSIAISLKGKEHKYYLLNGIDLSAYEKDCPICQQCPEPIECPVVTCPETKCPSRINLTEEIAKFFPNKPLYFVLGGLLIILLGVILTAVFKPVYPANKKSIWGIISMFIAGLAVCTGGLFGLAMPSWGWPLCTTVSAIITLALVLIFIFVRNMGLFRRP